jgi:hypothetical protein
VCSGGVRTVMRTIDIDSLRDALGAKLSEMIA